MATQPQMLANQQNAKSSTGPRTESGKLNSAANSTKHGLSSAFVVLPHEDQSEFTALVEQLRGEFIPQGEHQLFLVEQMAQSRWRLARIRRIEDAVFLKMMDEGDSSEDGDARIAAALMKNGSSALSLLQRYAAAAERAYYKAHREYHLAQQQTLETQTVRSIDRSISRLATANVPPMRNEPNRPAAMPAGWRPQPGENLALRL